MVISKNETLNLTAYLDESGTHDDSDAIVVAGFLSSASQWVEFSARWQMALNDFGLNYFHMTDFANKVPPYDLWTEPERRSNLLRLLNIIKATASVSVGISFQKQAFDLIFSERVKAVCGGAYGLAATACMLDVGVKLKELNIAGQIDYVYESGATGSHQVGKVFEYNLNQREQKESLGLSSMRFEPKKDFLPLQAADILAYELYKQLPKSLKLSDVAPRFPIKFLADIPWRWGFLDGNELQKWADLLAIRADAEDAGELKPI